MARPNPRATLGEGGRFAALEASIERRNREGPKRSAVAKKRPGGGKIESPGGLAAFLGRKKYGAKRFQALAAKGRRA